LDTATGVAGVTEGRIREELRPVGVLCRTGGGNLNPGAGELEVTAGWGHGGKGGVCMPGQGRVVARAYRADEQAWAAANRGLAGEGTCDIHLNDAAYYSNVPGAVWEYTIGGYQVVKKWLSYRERGLLGRGLTMEEARYVQEMIRRIAGLVLLAGRLDENYGRCKGACFAWGEGKR
jgi:hypothetical protein